MLLAEFIEEIGKVKVIGKGLLCVLVAAGLALTWFSNRKKERQAKLESIDVE